MTKRNQTKLTKGTTLTVQFSALANGGTCVGTVIEKDSPYTGLKVFVKGVVPSETAIVRITNTQGNFCEGELIELKTTSKKRIPAPCPFYEAGCGGCDYQYIETSTQRELKREMVEQILKYQANIIPENGVYLIGEDLPSYHYRKRITLHINKAGKIGFFQKRSGDVIECDKCLLIVNELNQLLPALKDFIKQNPTLFSGMILEYHEDNYFLVFKTSSFKPSQSYWQNLLTPLFPYFTAIHISFNDNIIYQYAKNPSDKFPFGHFCQVNTEGNKVLVEHILSKIQGHDITEFYAGAGNFSFPLASQGKNVTAIELDPALVQYANVLISQYKELSARLKFVASSTEKYLKRGLTSETILLDPPRSGAAQLSEACRPDKQKEIVYVSCYPATLTRDLKTLVSHGYQVKEVAVLDMFPQTQHVETICLLTPRRDTK